MNWRLNTGWKYPNAKTQEGWDAMTDRAVIIEECAKVAEGIKLKSGRDWQARDAAWLDGFLDGADDAAKDIRALAAVPLAPPFETDHPNYPIDLSPAPPSIPEREKLLEALLNNDDLINEIGLLFFDSMNVKCEPASYAPRCIRSVVSAIAALEGK